MSAISTTDSSTEEKPPRAVVFLRPDTLGDLVLFSPTLRCLRAAWPKTRIAVVIRRPYLELAPALAPGVEWIATRIDPFAQGPADVGAEFATLRQSVTALAPDQGLRLFATFRPVPLFSVILWEMVRREPKLSP